MEIDDRLIPPMLMSWDHHYITPMKEQYHMMQDQGEEALIMKDKSSSSDKS